MKKEGKILPFGPTRRAGSSTVGIGARDPEVEEPLPAATSILFEFEVDEVAEPKGLHPADLRDLVLRYGSYAKVVAAGIGTSETFVRQNSKG